MLRTVITAPEQTQPAAAHLVEIWKEMPRVVKAIYLISWKFRWHLLVLAGFNFFIAAWAVIQPLVLSWGVDTFVARAPYIKIVTVIVVPTLVITIPNGMILPFLREWYTLWFARLPWKRHMSYVCMAHQRSGQPKIPLPAKGPILQEGRDAAWEIVEFFTREPFFVLKGLVVACILLWLSPLLAGLVAIGTAADIFITLEMRRHILVPMAVMQRNELSVKGLENQALDQDIATVTEREYDSRWQAYFESAKRAGLLVMIYQTVWRGGISHIVRIGIMLLVGWWVHQGRVSIGEYLFLISLAASANDPFEIFLNFMWRIVEIRESLRRLGLVCGLDFGLKPPLV